MAHLIDKNVLISYIKEKRDLALMRQQNLESIGQETIHNKLVADMLNRLISFIDALEVKIDFENYNKVKRTLSLSFMNFLDSNRSEGKMCLSNGECFDIDKAFDEMDFAKLFRYMKKYLKI